MVLFGASRLSPLSCRWHERYHLLQLLFFPSFSCSSAMIYLYFSPSHSFSPRFLSLPNGCISLQLYGSLPYRAPLFYFYSSCYFSCIKRGEEVRGSHKAHPLSFFLPSLGETLDHGNSVIVPLDSLSFARISTAPIYLSTFTTTTTIHLHLRKSTSLLLTLVACMTTL